MNPTKRKQSGVIGTVILFCIAVISAGTLWIFFDEDVARKLKQEAEIQSMAVIGDVVTKRLACL